MNRAEFEARCRAEGYADIVERELAGGTVTPMHTHDFDAQLLVIGGEITIARDGAAQAYRAGDSCEVPAGTRHEERVGPAGVHYLAGRRHTAG